MLTERGSVLLLMPAAVLVVVVLGAISVDLAVVHLAERQAITLAADAANDAVTVGLDEAALRRGEGFRLDSGAVERSVAETVATSDLAPQVEDVRVTVLGPATVEVTLVVRAEYVFARALPGGSDGTTVRAGAAATVHQR